MSDNDEPHIPQGTDGHSEPEDVDGLLANIETTLDDVDRETPSLGFDEVFGSPPPDEQSEDLGPDLGFARDEEGEAPAAFDDDVEGWQTPPPSAADDPAATSHTGDLHAELNVALNARPASGIPSEPASARPEEDALDSALGGEPDFSRPPAWPEEDADLYPDADVAPTTSDDLASDEAIAGASVSSDLDSFLRTDDHPPSAHTVSDDLEQGPLNTKLAFGVGDAASGDWPGHEISEEGAPADAFSAPGEPEHAPESAGRPWYAYLGALVLLCLIGGIVVFLYQNLFGGPSSHRAAMPAHTMIASRAAPPPAPALPVHSHGPGSTGAAVTAHTMAPSAHKPVAAPPPNAPSEALSTPAPATPAATTGPSPNMDLTPPLAGADNGLGASALAARNPSPVSKLGGAPATAVNAPVAPAELKALVARAVAARTARLDKQLQTLEHAHTALLADVHSQISTQTHTLEHQVYVLSLELRRLRRARQAAHHVRRVPRTHEHHRDPAPRVRPHYTLVGAVDGRAVLLDGHGRDITVGVGTPLAGYGHITRIGADGCLYTTSGTISTDSAVCTDPKG